MYLDQQHPDGGMRPLPPEEGDAPSRLNLRSTKKPRAKEARHDLDVRHLTKRIEHFAENETSSDSDALKLIEDTRGTILKLRLIKSKNRKNKNGGRH